MNSSLQSALQLLEASSHAIAFTGAGISVASGIPDFRSPGGVWERHDPMEVATTRALKSNPEGVWRFLLEAFSLTTKAQPNRAHTALARMEHAGVLHGIITQNIDALHMRAGSRNVVEYHGTMARCVCMGCGQTFNEPEKIVFSKGFTIPWICDQCGGLVRPEIVFFGESIPLDALEKSGQLAREADLVMVIGTSGNVAPANTIPYEIKSRGGKVIVINPQETSYAGMADVTIRQPAETALPELAKAFSHHH
ncbi:SIR2 family NAD-dependent protein deacylase [Desulfovibrio inopinatus]|uniref:SIR2 family NAD-dependent protein deacylase n=1 Tax=Desulfovibrio inopinatus TaxID=102109 RepID=UPI000489508C|nr:NAD-dependent deacylase [Desulfovibrio inopinatus]